MSLQSEELGDKEKGFPINNWKQGKSLGPMLQNEWDDPIHTMGMDF